MKISRQLIPCVALTIITLGLGILPPASARRLPQPGGSVSIELPRAAQRAFLQLHRSLPLLQRRGQATQNDQTSLQGAASEWTSDLIESIQSSADHRRWTLSPHPGQLGTIRRTLHACLTPAHPTPWPAQVLAELQVNHTLTTSRDAVTLEFNHPVGPLPELLAACRVPVTARHPRGPFQQRQGNTLERNPGSTAPLPLLESITLTESGFQADVRTTRSTDASVSVLVAPVPDVILLLQEPATLSADPLKLASPEGLTQFYHQLGAPLLLSVHQETYGIPTRAILPPGVAPPRPLTLSAPASGARLSLPALKGDSPTHVLINDVETPIFQSLAERLSVLFRHHGYRLQEVSSAAPGTTRLVSWRSPTPDPALAILHLASTYQKQCGVPPSDTPLKLREQLLSAHLETRLEAALEIEREWVSRRLIVPVATLSAWYEINPHLRGVRIASEGVPLLHDAFWSE